MSIKNWPGEACSVYSITNKANGMQYIGVAKSPEIRFKEHSRPTSKYISYINRAINEHGKENFNFNVLLIGKREYCLEMEAKIVDHYKCLVPNGYNLCAGGRGRIQFYKGENHPQYGKRPPEDAIEKMRKSLTGKTQAPMPEYAKKAISESAKAQWANPEQRAKKMAGILAAANSEKRKQAVSAAQSGRKRTEEQKKRHSEIMKKRWAEKKQGDKLWA